MIGRPMRTILLAGCIALASTGFLDAARAQITPQNRAAIDAFYGVFNNHDLAGVDRALAPDWVDVPLAPGQGPGRDGFKPAARYFFQAFPDLRVINRKIVAQGDFVVVRSELSGTQRGAFAGAAPTGKRVDIMVMDMHELRGGRIVRSWHVEDWLGAMTQAGVWPPK